MVKPTKTSNPSKTRKQTKLTGEDNEKQAAIQPEVGWKERTLALKNEEYFSNYMSSSHSSSLPHTTNTNTNEWNRFS